MDTAKASGLAGIRALSFGKYASIAMRTYYFDLTDGVPTRDRKGLEFLTGSGAIEHSKDLAKRLRDDPRCRDSDLAVVVLDESGTEIHRERVYPDKPEAIMASGGFA
jgi:Domain of unknown function (DUF6894)